MQTTLSSRETSMAEQCARKSDEYSVAPIGDDIEPIGESRTDVEMGNEQE